MVPIMARKTPQDVAKNWLREHPEDLQRWLAGSAASMARMAWGPFRPV
ncbi:hypothetical protein V5O39_21610 [Pseudomonas parakoreensis]